MTKSYLVNHTHWDREWYFTDIDAQVLADYLFTEALNELKKQPDLNFTLDGQTSIVDEYVATHPERLNEIKQLVKDKRLFVGPWYTQTDAVNIDAEAFIKNAIVGIVDAKQKYGDPMMIGYLPDTFGFNANVPALMDHIGFKNFIFWRGMNYDSKVKSPYFKWIAPGGQSITAINLPPTGYSAAVITDQTKEDLKKYVDERLDKTIDFVHGIRGDKVALMPVGMDQVNVVKDVKGTLTEINKLSKNENIISSYPEFCEALKKIDKPVYSGELKDPVYARVHKTISSVRADQKLKSSHLEQVLLKRIEPLMVIAKKNDIPISTSLLIQAWKLLFENQAHDSMGGSVTDNVAIDIDHRYKQANELCDSIENLIKNKLAENMQLTDKQVLLLNTMPHEFIGRTNLKIISSTAAISFNGIDKCTLVAQKQYPERKHILVQTDEGPKFITEPAYYQSTFEVLVKLPALGYKVFNFEETDNVNILESSQNNISNGNVTVSFENGHAIVKDNNGKLVKLSLVDSGNDGDTYDYSPLKNDPELDLLFDNCQFEVGEALSKAIFSGCTNLPTGLKDRKSRSTELKPVAYQLIIDLDNISSLVQATIQINNDVDSHRMRLRIEHELNTTDSLAQIQDAFLKNSNKDIPEDWRDHFVEKPVNIFDFNKSVTVKNENQSISLISNDSHEYESNGDGLYMTLFSSTGELGKPDLEWRPGRASGDTTNQGHIMMKTPLAQTRGELTFNLALLISDTFSKRQLVQSEDYYLSQQPYYQTQELNKFINRLDNKIWSQKPKEILSNIQSNLNISGELMVASIYPSFVTEGKFIIRMVNMTDTTMELPAELTDAIQVDALENQVDRSTELKPYQIVSVKMNI